MVLESTVICADNSDFMRNEDYPPTRLLIQQNGIILVCYAKTRSNPENEVGLVTLANTEVLATLTTDVGHIITRLHRVEPKGSINLYRALRICQLVLRHRLQKHHKTRIVAFIGSPITNNSTMLIDLAKKFKKEKINVDVVSFGEDNSELLKNFINTINGVDGTACHLITITVGNNFKEVLALSPIIQGDGHQMINFSDEMDPEVDDDPELALALFLSMQDQTPHTTEDINITVSERDRQQGPSLDSNVVSVEANKEDMLTPEDIANMTEEEQLEYAFFVSMQYLNIESNEDFDYNNEKQDSSDNDDDFIENDCSKNNDKKPTDSKDKAEED